MANVLRIGVIGCGAIAQIMHIPYLVEHDEFALVSLCDAYEPVLVDVARRYGVEKRYTDWRELLTRDDLDAVVIAHAGSHHDSVIAALEAGLHVFVEKPLGWNLREVREVVEKAHASNRIVQVGYHKLYDPAFEYAKNAIKDMKDIGFVRVTVLHPENALGFSPHRIRRGAGVVEEGHKDAPDWETAVQSSLKGLAGGDLAPLVDEALEEAGLGARKDDPALRILHGMTTISLIHQIYMLFGLFGKPQEVISTDVWRDGLSIHSVIQLKDDVNLTLDWHYLSHLKDYREEYAVYGNYDRVILNFPSPYYRNWPSPVTIQGGEGELAWEKRVTVSLAEAFENELLAFYDNVIKGEKPVSSVDDALMHAEFVRDIVRAARVSAAR